MNFFFPVIIEGLSLLLCVISSDLVTRDMDRVPYMSPLLVGKRRKTTP